MSGGPAGPTVWLVDPRAHVPEYDHALGAALERLGCRVRLCVGPSWPDSTGGRTVPGRECREGAAGLGRAAAALRYPFDLLRLVARARRDRPDVVHWQWSVEPPLDALAMRALRRTGAATVLTLHNVHPHEWRPGQRQARDLLARHAEVVIVHSRATADRLVRELPECAGRTRVVPMSSDRPSGPGPSRQEARARLGLELTAGDRLVLFFGQVRPYKGLPVLLEAIERCRRVDGRVHLLVAGRACGRVAAGASPGPVAGGARVPGWLAAVAGGAAPGSRLERWLARAIRGASAGRAAPIGCAVRGRSLGGVRRADGVIWRLGARPEAEVPLLFAACDVVALPYLRTDDSAVLPQALAHGRAVVASAVGGLPEALSRGGGELVPSGDAAALSAALLGLLADGDRLQRLEAAAAAAASAWSWDDAARATCRLYAGLLVEPGPTRPRS